MNTCHFLPGRGEHVERLVNLDDAKEKFALALREETHRDRLCRDLSPLAGEARGILGGGLRGYRLRLGFKTALVVAGLPKTRSGKILRGTMRKIAEGETYRLPATIDDPAVLVEIGKALATAGYAKR
jgi:hypothetical protein